MPSAWNRWLAVVSAANGLLVVALGAFAAHGLLNYVSENLLPTWQTGVRYHMFHVIAALIAVVISRLESTGHIARRLALLAACLFLGGILFFCGSLYLLVLAPQSWLMMTAPFGGIMLLLAWALLTWALICNK
jgi:uncharacterized membrane protein YgdD (TMEM256/DUF423 family)